MKRQKQFPRIKSIYGVIVTVFLVFFLGTSITVFSDSYDLTLQEERKLAYGAWHIAIFDAGETVSESLRDHAAVDLVGEMRLSGTVMDGENVIGGIGCFDEQLAQMGNITLLDGRYPSSANEIAMEAAVLTRLGYSLELGQKIQLCIAHFDDSLRPQTPDIQEFTLTGVIKNYASNWKSDTDWLVSCCVNKAYCEKTEATVHVFGQLNSNFAQYADSLQSLSINKGTFIKNDYTYYEYSEGPVTGSGSAILHTAIILSGCLSLVIVINNELSRRKVSFVTMRILGATKLQIILMFLRERFYAICLAGATGIITGIAFPYIAIAAANGFLDGDLFYQMIPGHILQIASLSSLGVILSLGLGIARIFSTPLTGRVDQQVTRPLKQRKGKILNRNNLYKLLGYSNRGCRWVSGILACISAVLVLLSAYDAWVVYREYAYFCQNYPEDYSFGMIASNYNPPGYLLADDLELIRNAYGVKEVFAYSASDFVGIDFTQEYDEVYADATRQSISNIIDKLPDAGAYGRIIGVTDNLIPLYWGECGSDRVPLQDGEVILYIPDLYRSDGSAHPLEYERGVADKNLIVREGPIEAGQTLRIKNAGNQTELSVAGVIRSFSSDLAFSLDLVRPYSIICNEQTFSRLFGRCQYTYVLAFGDPNAIQYQTDVELSKVQTQLYFTNNRLFRAEKLQSFTVKLVLSSIVLAASFFLTAMIRYGVQASSDPSEAQKLLVLYRLGMSKKALTWAYAVQAIRESLLGSSVAAALFVVYRCAQERNELLFVADYLETKISQITMDILTRCFMQTHWLFVFAVLLLVACINCTISMVHNCNRIKITCDQ